MKKAILIAANPFVKGNWGKPLAEIGSVLAHACYMVRHGGVFWRLISPGQQISKEFPHSDIETAYFYDVPSQTVTYRAKVEFAGTPTEVPSKAKYRWYTPEFREFPDDSSSSYLLLLTSIARLDDNHGLGSFKKLDGTPVQRVQNYVIIEDPEYEILFEIH